MKSYIALNQKESERETERETDRERERESDRERGNVRVSLYSGLSARVWQVR